MAHPAVKPFVRGIDRSKRRSEMFADFCELAYCALATGAFTPAAALFVAAHGYSFANRIGEQQASAEVGHKKAVLVAILTSQHMPVVL